MWPPRLRLCERYRIEDRHCEEPTGRANARPMTGSATKQSILSFCGTMDCFAALAMTVLIHGLLPGEHRLFQLSHAGVAPLQHFAELVDQGRGRRVDESSGVTKPDHAPRTLWNG